MVSARSCSQRLTLGKFGTPCSGISQPPRKRWRADQREDDSTFRPSGDLDAWTWHPKVLPATEKDGILVQCEPFTFKGEGYALSVLELAGIGIVITAIPVSVYRESGR